MRDEFYRVYRLLDEEYSVGGKNFERSLRRGLGPLFAPKSLGFERDASLAIVNAALEEVLRKVPDTLRPDAVHFLRVNLHQMVTAPLLHPVALRSSAVSVHPDELVDDLRHDTEMLIQEARNDSAEYVTGHGIVNALARAWKTLRVNAFELWG